MSKSYKYVHALLMILLVIGIGGCGSESRLSNSAASGSVTPEELRPVLIGHRYGYADLDNRLVIRAVYDDARHFSEGLAFVRKGDKTGYINVFGKMVIDQGGGDFHNGLAVVMKRENEHVTDAGEQWNYINSKGDVILKTPFYRANSFSEGLASVLVNETNAAYIDATGKVVLDDDYGYAGDFKNGLAVVLKNQKWGIIDAEGKAITKFVYEEARDFSENKAAVMDRSKWGFIDSKGNPIIKPAYEDVLPFQEGLAGVKEKSKWGFVNEQGNMQIPPRFAEIHSFSEGLAAVREPDGKWGYIDAEGSYVIEPQYEEAYESENQTLLVRKVGSKRYTYIDHAGKIVHFSK